MGGLKRFWRSKDPRIRTVRDIVAMGLVLLLVVGGVWIYSGQGASGSPVVAVESGSMMHGPFLMGNPTAPTSFGSPPFGRIGTIDPGDTVIVKRVRTWEDVSPAFGPGSVRTYGAPGDVVVFARNGVAGETPIIHRAMLLVRAVPEGCRIGVDCTYVVPAACDAGFVSWGGSEDQRRYCQGANETFSLHLARDGLTLDLENFPACGSCTTFHTSLVTKGDNNPSADPWDISAPVRLEWIKGKARGELPWLGVVKLAVAGNCHPAGSYREDTDPTRGANWQILRGCAPWDIWTAFGISILVLFGAPMLVDPVRRFVAARRNRGPQR